MEFRPIFARLTTNERNALDLWAKTERRDSRDAAALLIIEGLQRRGLLPTPAPPPAVVPPVPAQEVDRGR